LTLRLGDGTAESHERMQAGLEALWRFTGEMFQPVEGLDATGSGVASSIRSGSTDNCRATAGGAASPRGRTAGAAAGCSSASSLSTVRRARAIRLRGTASGRAGGSIRAVVHRAGASLRDSQG
jgi:ring-1,2-phenylacetyl-CoA epoxidase subunit PaaC